MSDTPRTDATVTGNSEPIQEEYEDLAFFARTLERELEQAKQEIETLRNQIFATANERLIESGKAKAAGETNAQALRDIRDRAIGVGLKAYVRMADAALAQWEALK